MSKGAVIVSSQRDYRIRDDNSDGILGVSDFTENKNIWRALLAECLGTLLLVLIGTGSCIDFGTGDEAGHVRIAFTFGLTVATIAQAIGHISGCHINPAVTISFLLTREVKIIKAVSYVIVQCVGAIGGSALLKLIVPDSKIGGFGVTNVNPSISAVQGMIMEAALTFLLIFVIHGVCDSLRKDIKGSAPLAIGLAVTAAHFCGLQYTGCGINPARSFGPAVIINKWDNHWVYWVGPLIGATLASLIYQIIFKVKKDESYDL
ncbi:aquaporin AQPAe.a isoform X1 [Diorhabda sublineata]|uniref:aquaporin AQPAe.a isoform X1 n=1 Tax=Diorhabda sublineata TaxID=1163346 RepID=UPI0024E047D4|nr:aquaporin AQPAe.a isoform X1 [Diorhabda sublineata]